jgi:hypothetical protein
LGTRGAYGFHVDGQDKATYNHGDSYPSGLGVTLLNFLRTADIAALKEVAKSVRLVDDKVKPTPQEIEKYKVWANTGVSSGKLDEWYVLLRESMGEPDAWLAGCDVMLDGGATFMQDSLYCEWAYLINLDDGVFEVYKGFNKDPMAPGRYARSLSGSGGYAGVRLIDSIPLEQLQGLTDGDCQALLSKWEPRDADE